MEPPTEAEPPLPYVPSHTGRKSRLGYLGFDGVAFNDLWPLFAGLVATIGLGLDFFVGGGWARGHWIAKTAVAATPLAGGFGYLRLLVAGRPPHFKGDLWAAALAVSADFADPPLRWLPLGPRLHSDLAAAAGPARAADREHPRHGLAARFAVGAKARSPSVRPEAR